MVVIKVVIAMLNVNSETKTFIEDAVAKQLLPKEASLKGDETQTPLPIMLLTTLGVWFAVVPLVIGFLWLLLDLFGDDFFESAPLLLIISSALLVGSAYQLRKKNVPMFLEQLAFSVLLTGGLMFSIGLYQGFGLDDVNTIYFVLLSLLATGFAYLIPLKWIRLVLGGIASALIGVAWQASIGWGRFSHEADMPAFFMASSYMLGLWAMLLIIQYRVMNEKLALTTAIEPFATGWVVVGLVALAVEAGRTFLIGSGTTSLVYGLQNASVSGVLFAVAGFWFIGKRWRQLQQTFLVVVALLITVLVWFMPSLGGAIFVLAVAATSKRYKVAIFAALTAAWVIGAFYYQLHWSLSNKALLLILVAIGLGEMAWFQHKRTVVSGVQSDATNVLKMEGFQARHLLLACGSIVLLVANIGIWQKEDVIANGTPIFVKLAPVDPRSLMQGDYMALNYVIPTIPKALRNMPELYAVAERKQPLGDVQINRIDGPKATLADGEFLIKLKHMPRGWTIVSDAWYFKEGTGKRWENAQYGEFRVKPDGSALLVGLADVNLQSIAKSD